MLDRCGQWPGDPRQGGIDVNVVGQCYTLALRSGGEGR
ncbi:MAG: hypothetical protein AVDCRST_MAG70-2285 [uncultured Thermomicrobiales bacterium]|uniref:Uncharacterized protein n=1 Tax=uncultured Thermomicrobiales bacterium TaxID=1645740 RepID=A0A6J4VAB3_9BACT|nr:MAG: hypothetical protein AVDCRST_MAG70-2285 [uncultured Thermomicrobiales bacterium]